METAVLSFWFEEIEPRLWFATDSNFDNLIKKRFYDLMQQAAAGELFNWRSSAKGRLAEIIVLDQFSRNVYRNTPQAFAQDPMALVLAQEAIASGALKDLNATQRSFLLLPLMHSESKAIHEVAQALYQEYAPATNYEFELKHKAIIDRFGRYPHRNELLGRVSTPEEITFLMQADSKF